MQSVLRPQLTSLVSSPIAPANSRSGRTTLRPDAAPGKTMRPARTLQDLRAESALEFHWEKAASYTAQISEPTHEKSCFRIRDGFAIAFGGEVVIEPNMRTIQTMSLCE